MKLERLENEALLKRFRKNEEARDLVFKVECSLEVEVDEMGVTGAKVRCDAMAYSRCSPFCS